MNHSNSRSVLIIGNFDGVHKGHQKLISQAKSIADSLSCGVLAITFWPHPQVFLDINKKHFYLSNQYQRKQWLKKAGVDHVFLFSMSLDRIGWSAEDFMQRILIPLHPYVICLSPNFRFGYKQQGTIKTLKQYFDIQTVELDTNSSNIPYSSSSIRDYLIKGEMKKASQYLTRPFSFEGFIRSGEKLGQKIGFPTINIDMGNYQHPKAGVYRIKIHIPKVGIFDGVANIGYSPTFSNRTFLCEAYLFNFNKDTLLIYGTFVLVECFTFIREEKRFDSTSQLQQAIQEDVNKALQEIKS